MTKQAGLLVVWAPDSVFEVGEPSKVVNLLKVGLAPGVSDIQGLMCA